IIIKYKIANYNILLREVGRRPSHPFRALRKGVVFMSTYEEFMVIINMALLIVAILSFTHKK
ncbi:hypothetical protein, partial [Anaerostipes caccae]|uniref:hypothetical protein n=1 Tax=Anaerostipes caccae TaxID=105841 RepID=UPI0039F4CFFE